MENQTISESESVEVKDVKLEESVIEPEKKEEATNFLVRLMPPHKLKSRIVKDEDIPRLVEDLKVMYNLCFTQNGPYAGNYAICHPQIDNTDPLRAFVTSTKEILINPKIIKHTKAYVDSLEGCATFPQNPPKIVNRFNKITVEFQTLNGQDEIKLSPVITEEVSGLRAKIFQHEISHMAGKYIYDEDYKPEDCLDLDK